MTDLNNFRMVPSKIANIKGDVRVVFYDNKASNFSDFYILDADNELVIPLSKFESHYDYKYKIQNKINGKWIDTTKYKRFIPEAITSQGIEYAFFPAKNSKYLVVIFQAINRTPGYNYIKILNGININRLYIKDGYGTDIATRSSYYLGPNKDFNIADACQNLIHEVAETITVKPNNIIFTGSSKGGFAALYHGISFGDGFVFAGGPQILLGDYLGHTSEKSIRPPIFRYLFGEVSRENIDYGNRVLFEKVDNSSKYPHTIVIHIGIGEPHYQEHVLPFFEYCQTKSTNLISLDIQDYNTHEELAIFFPKFLLEKISELVKDDNV